MLRVYASRSAQQAKSYFSNELSKGDYYSEGQEIVGVWGGKAAEMLGLSGTVNKDAFNALVDNRFPHSNGRNDEPLTGRDSPDRRSGFDINFSAPKALSILYEYSKDERLLDAFRESVHSTMQSIEEYMHTRVRKNGANTERHTGNLVYAEFVHFTARPVDGQDPDPNLHAHCYTHNITRDFVENEWKAGEFFHIKKDAPYFEAMFHSHLSKALSDMGLNIERDGKFWTIDGIEKDTLKKYSHRTEEIEKKAEELGIKSDKAKDGLGATTRSRKDGDKTRDELRKDWWKRLSDEERATLDKLSQFDQSDDNDHSHFTAEETVAFALKHRLEKQSVHSVNRLKETALRQGFGSVTPDQVDAAFNSNAEILVVGDKATTKEILIKERQIINRTSQGYGIHRKLNPDYEIGLVTDHEKGKQFELSKEQKNVVSTLLNSRDDIQAIQSKAGTGKTTTLATLIDGIEQGGGSAMVLAPTADAAYDTLRQDGDAYQSEAMQNAQTLARYLVDEKLRDASKGSTLIVDEAGLMGVDDMHTLFDHGKQNNNRIILVGDITQHNAVMCGDAFRILQQEAGLNPVSLEEIRRQDGDYKAAVKTIAEGKLEAGFNKLDNMGQIHEIPDDNKRYSTLANRYADVFQKKGTSALTVAPTKAEGSLVNEAIRDELKARKLIDADEKTLTRLTNLHLTEAERGDSFHYESGQTIRFQKNGKGEHGRIYKSTEFTVSEVVNNDVWVADDTGQTQRLDLSQTDKFQVYEERDIDLAVGDDIRITEGHKSLEGKRLNNGAIYKVKAIDENGNIKLNNDWVIDGSKGNFDHGYVRTSIASQGKSIDHIFLAQGADYAGATSTEQFYVSVSRGKKSVELFTDDKDEIRKQIQHSNKDLSATELMKNRQAGLHDVMDNEDSFLAMLGMYARNLYENMKENTQHWLSSFGQQPAPQQQEQTKWRDLVSQQRDDKERDISL